MPKARADIIVIGGGIAGLAAAAELGRRGVGVTLLEARERLGGRIRTERIAGWRVPVELGAQFVHAGNSAFWRLLRRHRIATRRVPPRHWLFRDDELAPIPDVAREIASVTEQIRPRKMRGWSFADFLRRSGGQFTPDQRNLALGFVEGFEAAPARRMSATAIAGETLEDDDQFLLPGGYTRVVEAVTRELAQRRVQIECSSVVTQIEWQRGAVRVRAAARDWFGRAAIIALPLGVWQAPPSQHGAVSFSPVLREKMGIARRIGVGHVIRVNLRLAPRCWRAILPEPLERARRGGFGFIHSRIEGLPVWWALSSETVLTGWAGGPVALELAGRSVSRIAEQAVSSISHIFGVAKATLRTAVVDFATHNWTTDPFSRGAYSFIAAGHEDAAERFRAPMQDTLFFAGEATADGEEVGTVHGAFSSGLRAAEEVRAALR